MSRSLYMVIRTTNNEHAQILYVAEMEIATLLGQLYRAEHPDQKCIAPPLEGRGFAKIDLAMLQYVYWNTFQSTPPEDYTELIKQCVERASKIEVTHANPESLRAELALFGTEIVVNKKGEITKEIKEKKVPKPPKAAKAPRQPRSESDIKTDRPRAGTTTGLVWDIIDKHFANVKDVKVLRNVALEECKNEGLNPSTFSVQFGKWRAAQGL